MKLKRSHNPQKVGHCNFEIFTTYLQWQEDPGVDDCHWKCGNKKSRDISYPAIGV